MIKLENIYWLLKLLVKFMIVILDFIVKFFDIDIGELLLENVGIVFVINNK